MEMQDRLKLVAAILVLVAGVVGFYLLPADQGVLRALLFVVSIAIAAGVVWLS